MRLLGYLFRKRVGSKKVSANRKGGGRVKWGGACPSRVTGCGVQRPKVEACSKYVSEKWLVSERGRGAMGRYRSNYYVSGDCLLYACAEGVFGICLKSRVEDYTLNNHLTTKWRNSWAYSEYVKKSYTLRAVLYSRKSNVPVSTTTLVSSYIYSEQ